MSRKIKITLAALLAVATLLTLLCGCEMRKTYSENGVSIRLPDGFEKKIYPGTSIFLTDGNISIVIMPENTPTIDIGSLMEDYSAEDYAALFALGHKGSETGVEKGMAYAQYDYAGDDGLRFCMSFVIKTDINFYMAQFDCKAEEKEEYRPEFIKWAKSIKIND